jgi:homocitrate synthase NifV
MLKYKLRKDIDWVFRRMEDVIGFATKHGLTVSFGAEDASRTETGVLLAIYRHARDLGATRVRYADTLGIMTPDRILDTMRLLNADLGIPLDFHGHNDFGLATANALCAWKGGASVISCSLLGLGERAGNTAMEEIVGSIQLVEHGFSSFDFPRLKQLCEDLSRCTNRPIPPAKPLLGEAIFTHESGIHVDGLLKSPETYEFFPPEAVGGKRRLVVGKYSGRSSLKHLASLRGCPITNAQAEAFLGELRTKMTCAEAIDCDAEFETFLAAKRPDAIAQDAPRSHCVC